MARWFKLHISHLIRDRIFYDCDDLKSLDTIFGIVTHDTRNLVVLLTREILWRMWCAGEITSASYAGVHIVLVHCEEDWQMPTEEDLERVGPCWTEGQQMELLGYGIGPDSIRTAYRRLRELHLEEFPQNATPEERENRCHKILHQCQHLRWRLSTRIGAAARFVHEPAKLLVLADPHGAEPLTIAMVLQSYIRRQFDEQVDIMRGSFEERERQVEGAEKALVVLTRSALRNEAFLEMLELALDKRNLGVLPLVADEHFRYPDREFYFLLLGDDFRRRAMNAYTALFLVIGARFSPHSSELIQLAEVMEVIQRLRSINARRLKSELFTPRRLTERNLLSL